MTLMVPKDGLLDGVDVAEACQRLEAGGADVVGCNCVRGPKSIIPLMKKIKKVCKVSLLFFSTQCNLIGKLWHQLVSIVSVSN